MNTDDKSLLGKLKELNRYKIVVLAMLIMGMVTAILFFAYKIINSSWKDKADEAEEVAKEIIKDVVVGEEGKVSTITRSALEDVFERSDLSTADYIFNAVAECRPEGSELADYYVAYEGTVKAGIDFSRIIIVVNEEEKVVEMKLPPCEITDTIVDFGSMEYIFVNEKAENESVSQEAYKLCQEDIKNRAGEDKKLLELADKNAKDAIEALVKPWVMQIDPEYKVEIK